MPSLSRRRNFDGRHERLESEVRVSEMQGKDFAGSRKFLCQQCGHVYQEKSRNCPRCDKRTMAEIRPIPDRDLDEARRNARRRAERDQRERA